MNSVVAGESLPRADAGSAVTRRLAVSLWAWDLLGLELGEIALYTADSSLGGLLAQAALWRGASQVLQIGESTDGKVPPGVEVVPTDNPLAVIRALAPRAARAPGFAAIDTSGRADTLDIFFEVVPTWGRILLGAEKSQPATVDFYNNVHRKGVTLVCRQLGPEVTKSPELAPHIERAAAILGNPRLAKQCIDVT